eukprot:2472800-Rhodomonas_salina.2
MLYAVVSLAISHGWIIQTRATAGLLLSVGPIVNDETFELQLDQPDPYLAVDEASLPRVEHSDTRADWNSYSKEIESALDLRGVLWFPPKSCSRVPITPHLLETPETVAPSDAAWTVIPHALWYEGYSLAQAIGLVLSRGKCLAITQPRSQGVYLLSQHEQSRREQLGIADSEYVPLAWDDRPEAAEGISLDVAEPAEQAAGAARAAGPESDEAPPPLQEEQAADARPRPPVLTDAEWRQRSLDTLQAARDASLEAEALMHIANLRVALAARKTEAAARCEATVQASINFPAPDETPLRQRLENLTDEVARLNARLESMDDMTYEDRCDLQLELELSTAQLSQTREIH